MSCVSCTIAEGVCEIRLERAEKLNAITPDMWIELNEALDRAETDDSVRVILFSAAGRAFCVGADLNAFSADSMGDEVPSGLDNPGGRLTARLPQLKKPMIAAVQGHVIGFGVSLILQCDVVLAAPTARFALPFVQRGFVPEGGSSLSLVQRVGYLRAAQMMLAGEAIDASTAKDWALVTHIVDEAVLREQAIETARRIAGSPPGALQRTRELLRRPSNEIAEQIRRESDAFTAQLRSDESKEAIAAFLEKRKPDFSRFR